MVTELEDRLRQLRDSADPSSEATSRALKAALDALPQVRPMRWQRWQSPRRVVSVGFSVAGVVAIVAVLALAIPRGETSSASAAITLVAKPNAGGVVDAVTLDRTAQLIERRAALMSINGVDAQVENGDIVLEIPEGAPSAALTALTRTGDFSVYDASSVIIGPEPAAASGQPLRTGQRLVEMEVEGPKGVKGYDRLVIQDRPELTSADVASAALKEAAGEGGGATVEVVLNDQGRRHWHDLTRELAQQGAVDRDLHGALLVLDGRVVSYPVIDSARYPDGISTGTISFESKSESADAIAAQLATGPLPVALAPAG